MNNRNSNEPTAETPNNNGDRNDNGMDVPNPQLTGVQSGVVTLDYTTTSSNETDLGPVGTTELPATNNLTVDFGFVAIPTAIDDETEPTRLRQIYFPAIRQSLAIDR